MRIFLITLLFVSQYAQSQEIHFDTIITSQIKQYEFIEIQWTIQDSFQFEITEKKLSLSNGDTINQSKIIDTTILTIKNIENDKLVFNYSLGKNSLSKKIFTDSCVPKQWDTMKSPIINGQYSIVTDSFSIRNCDEIYNSIAPNFIKGLECIKNVDSLNFIYNMLKSYPIKLKKCQFQSDFLLLHLKSILSCGKEDIIPLNDSLQFSVFSYEDYDIDTLQINRIVKKQKLENGNIRYSFKDDENIQKTKLSDNSLLNYFPSFSFEIEVDSQNQLVEFRNIIESHSGENSSFRKEKRIRRLNSF